jgi:hypothetical protein
MGRTTFSGPVRSLNGFIGEAPATGAAGSGIAGTGTIHGVSVTRNGSIIETKILMDITGLTCSNGAGDIIGVDDAANCHIGQITDAVNGTIFAGTMRCLEAPAGGDPDIDLWAADVGTGVENAPIADVAGDVQLTNAGDMTLGSQAVLTAFPADGQYLYLACGTATAAAYTAGKIEITLYGTV